MKFGLLGRGRFGEVIESALILLGEISWRAKSDSDFTRLDLPDWVFIATPNHLHYEQALYFLSKSVNVFVEKPATLSLAALESLIACARDNGCKFYVSDVFRYRKDVQAAKNDDVKAYFRWSKAATGSQSSILDRLAYHHLYLIYYSVDKIWPRFDVKVAEQKGRQSCDFTLCVEDKNYNFSYDATGSLNTEHIIFGSAVLSSQPFAVKDMIQAVIDQSCDFSLNHRAASWATCCLENIKRRTSKKIAIVGGGMFGCVAAIEFASRGYQVTLFEKNSELLQETSSINQYRVHRGYHYPRSPETAASCMGSSESFVKSFRQAIVSDNAAIDHYYGISSRDSLTTPQQFREFMDSENLDYQIVDNLAGTSLTVKVDEDLFDPNKMLVLLKERLFGCGVNIKLNVVASESNLVGFDFSVIATYGGLNQWHEKAQEYQFELCEKPIFRLPVEYRNKSIVIMDGPFMCIDPLGSSAYHVLGNVVHAIHCRNVGYEPLIPDEFEGLLNAGLVTAPRISNAALFIESAKEFFPGIEKSKYIGSMFTVRVVQSKHEHDDARPTLVNLIRPNMATIFSGKICTCLEAAKKVVELSEIADRDGVPLI
jgi:hypothetical protein